MTRSRTAEVEKLLLEAAGQSIRAAVPGTVRLDDAHTLSWDERRGPMRRHVHVDWDRFWDLIDAALSPAQGETGVTAP